jgi:shikimate kinase
LVDLLKKNLVLTGMMGVGKTTIGKKLAEKLKIKFVDIDKIIEAREKKTIKEIFELDGESYFRQIEKNITLDILRKKKLVIALGGGAFMNSEIRKEVIKTSISVWLDLSPKNLISRLKNTKKRPLLNKNNLNELINEIYSRRKKNYNESNCRIKCDFLEKNQIVNKIINLYEKSKNKD